MRDGKPLQSLDSEVLARQLQPSSVTHLELVNVSLLIRLHAVEWSNRKRGAGDRAIFIPYMTTPNVLPGNPGIHVQLN